MDSLVKAAHKVIAAHGAAITYWIAYSGGLDSHVLLHLFAKLRATHSIDLRAIHVNHKVSEHAENWAAHCAAQCAKLNISLAIATLHIAISGLNLEETLREARYAAFKKYIKPGDVLLTAHQQNDQAETILLQLCRGAGPQGLSAMPFVKPFAEGFHERPLLDFTREDLLRYATEHQLQWIEDESNTHLQFTRNFLRHEILPLLAKRWPTITKTLSRSAKQCADAATFIAAASQEYLTQVCGSMPYTLSVKKLLRLDENKQRHILRMWISEAGFVLPSAVKLQQLLNDILFARPDKMPCVQWGDAEVRRYRDDLFIAARLIPHDSTQIIPWDLQTPLTLPDFGCLHAKNIPQHITNVTVRFRQGGETIRLANRKHSHDLKKLFQQWNILPWLRDRMPLININDELAVIPNHGISAAYVSKIPLDGFVLSTDPSCSPWAILLKSRITPT